jgi:hypothetical protein
MVAPIQSPPIQSPPAASDRPSLRVIRGGLDPASRSGLDRLVVDRDLLAVIAGLMLVFGGLLAVRSAQAASAGPTTAAVTVAPAVIGESTIVVRDGDTLWAIAEDLAPGRDPRPIVDALADRNGGTALQSGDVLIIPAEVLATMDAGQFASPVPSASSS